MSLPKISIITPSFNQGEYIEETIQSVLNQRYPNLEYIIIDGGSQDNTLSILQEYADQFAYWVSEKDSGQTNAINKGLSLATGEIVAILNSDDAYLPGALDFVADQFTKNPSLRWMSAPSLYWGPDRANMRKEIMPVLKPSWLGGWLIEQCIPHPSTFAKLELFQRHGNFDESYFFAMDHEMWCRWAFAGEELHVFDRPLSAYRVHGDSKSVVARDRMRLDLARTREKYMKHLTPSQQRKVNYGLRQVHGMSTLTPALDILRKGDRIGAMKEWKKRVANDPSVRFTRYWATTWLRIALNKP